ncbi:MAG: hypothetical protein AAF383_24280 [Cyanobacteria bacterium P01_A01_bin.83]
MNPGDFSAFAASLKNLTKEEIRQAKVLYMKRAITGYESYCQNIPLFLLLAGCVCMFMFFNSITVFPFFALLPLLFLFYTFKSIKNSLRYSKKQINNALEIWKEDLGDDYFKFKIELEKIEAKIPIINIPLA